MKPSKLIKTPTMSEKDYCIPLLGTMHVALDTTFAPASAPLDHAHWESVLQAKLENLREEIEQTAFAEGREQGRNEAAGESAAQVEGLKHAVETMEQELARQMHHLENSLVDVVMAVSRKMVGVASELNLDLVRQSIKKVMTKQREPGEMLTLHLHPEDYQHLAPSDNVTPRNLRLVPDDFVQRGGCVLENKFGLLDAQIENQLTELARAIREQVQTGGFTPQLVEAVEKANEVRMEGRVVNVVGTIIEAKGPNVTVGEQCEIFATGQSQGVQAEVIGFKNSQVLLMPLGINHGLGPGNRVVAKGTTFTVKVGDHLLGRVLNGMGEPIDGKGPLSGGESIGIYAPPNNPMQRRSIQAPLYTGVRAIDGLLTCAKGGRMGIFSGSGVGKSVLLGMMARNTRADVNVIALIGERGREVREFIEHDLGSEGLERSVVIAVTSDESPVLRLHGAQLAATVAEYFALRQGLDVMFMMDSVTRFAMAQREIGLAAGEPPTTKGYTPSTFALLPKLLERSGIFGDKGSITGFYTVLVENDDMDEPVADHVRSILDGHIVLSRSLFSQNHFPAIDVLKSISRLAKQVCTREQQEWNGFLRDNLAIYQEAQDLVNIGAYVQGSNSKIDRALEVIEEIKAFLKQGMQEKYQPEEVWAQMRTIIEHIKKD